MSAIYTTDNDHHSSSIHTTTNNILIVTSIIQDNKQRERGKMDTWENENTHNKLIMKMFDRFPLCSLQEEKSFQKRVKYKAR